MKLRLALAAAVTTVVLSPGVSAAASLKDSADTVRDSADTVRQLATSAANLVAQEQQLLILIAPGSNVAPADLAQARAQLRLIDLEGQNAMNRFDELGVELSEAIRTVLDRLPGPVNTTPEQLSRLIPLSVVYDAAIADLHRIASTPGAILPTVPNEDSNGSSSLALLVVAAGALLVLGIAALTNTLRRRPVGDDLAALAWSDGLTGLANRRRLDHDLDAQRRSRDVSAAVIMIDVDHFKRVNDTFGHQIGDEILRQVSTVLSAQIRQYDVVYRYGGEEFCILLPGASTTDARWVADRIVNAVREIRLPDGSHVTVSIGIAEGTSAHVNTTLQSADRALYTAKENGRDRAVCAELTPV